MYPTSPWIPSCTLVLNNSFYILKSSEIHVYLHLFSRYQSDFIPLLISIHYLNTDFLAYYLHLNNHNQSCIYLATSTPHGNYVLVAVMVWISGSQGLDICRSIAGSTGAHNVEGRETRSNEDGTETLNIAKAEADRTCLSA